MRAAVAVCLPLVLILGCATTQAGRQEEADAVKSIAEAFHRRARWKDFSSAANLLVPDRRAAFSQARERQGDERDLTISDYELLELRLDPDGARAEVISRVSWLRLPSLSERADTVVTELVRVDRAWLIARQNKGPFIPELQDAWLPPTP